jgi:hypothetical protein
MIFTECCYCDNSLLVGYEAGDEGAGGFVGIECDECGKESVVELVSIGGITYPKEEFKKLFIDSGKVEKKKFKNNESKV